MKLIDAIEVRQGKFEIPDCTREDLPYFFVEMGYKVGVEIGVWKGHFATRFLRVGLKLFAIDPWLAYPDFNDKNLDMETLQRNQDGCYKVACWRLSSYSKCVIIKATSMEAVGKFKDNSVDFVYIDGNHGLKYIVEDIWEWSKKVRPGGTISGHDYLNRTDWMCHGELAVNACVQALGIEHWYVLGREFPDEGERRERYRSWMWLKP